MPVFLCSPALNTTQNAFVFYVENKQRLDSKSCGYFNEKHLDRDKTSLSEIIVLIIIFFGLWSAPFYRTDKFYFHCFHFYVGNLFKCDM